MKKDKIKKTVKIVAIVLCSIIVLFFGAVAIALNFVFSPEKITPLVLENANKMLNAKVEMKSAELTFFSTFPEFGLKLTDSKITSKAFRDTLFTKTDSLLSCDECIVTVNIADYLRKNEITINELSFKNGKVYAFTDSIGKCNWDIVMPSDSIENDSTQADSSGSLGNINVKKMWLSNINLTYDDRNTQLYARVDSMGLKLRTSLSKHISTLQFEFTNKNILYWQEGQLLVNKIKPTIKAEITNDQVKHLWEIKNAEISLDELNLSVNGNAIRNKENNTLDLNLKYGMKVPSVESVLRLIPESIVKKEGISANGKVEFEGTVKGIYGDKQIPIITNKIKIIDATAQYKGLPYGIDLLTADISSYIDLMKNSPSWVELKIFRFKGAETDIYAEGRADDLLGDPKIVFKTKSDINLSLLNKIFPLQPGVSLEGKVKADMNLQCTLSALKDQDLNRIKVKGDFILNNVKIKDENKKFEFVSQADFHFTGNKRIEANATINNLSLISRFGNATIEKMTLQGATDDPRDSTAILNMNCLISLSRLKASMGDSMAIFSKKTTANIQLRPSKRNKKRQHYEMAFRCDTLFMKANEHKIGMDLAGFKVNTSKINDTTWYAKGVIGFNRLKYWSKNLGLPVHMKETSISLEKRVITLNQAKMKIGNSSFTASGWVKNIYKAMTKENEVLTGKLTLTSRNIDCNQLINAFAGNDTTASTIDSTGTVSSDSQLALFVIPKNLDLELNTDLKKVSFNKMLFENVSGRIDVKNQVLNLENLSMNAMGADLKLIMLYRARSKQRGYTGFDLDIKNINIGKLVYFIPELDTIVPMLKSFQGKVNFNVAAESVLDSTMNVRIPTLRSAMRLEGDSLVLFDSETFAKLSKILMFKNKKENVINNVSVNITVDKGVVNVYPFAMDVDRYKVAVGGEQKLDMTFKYHVSILKSPLPFKAGVDIYGNPDKVKFKITKAKYKDMVTPAYIQQIDSTRINMGKLILSHFDRLVSSDVANDTVRVAPPRKRGKSGLFQSN